MPPAKAVIHGEDATGGRYPLRACLYWLVGVICGAFLTSLLGLGCANDSASMISLLRGSPGGVMASRANMVTAAGSRQTVASAVLGIRGGSNSPSDSDYIFHGEIAGNEGAPGSSTTAAAAKIGDSITNTTSAQENVIEVVTETSSTSTTTFMQKRDAASSSAPVVGNTRRRVGTSGSGGTKGSTVVDKTLNRMPSENEWQCLQYDNGKDDSWCGKESIKTHFGDVHVVNKASRPWAEFKGCGQCFCCMRSYPMAAPDDIPKGAPDDIREEIRAIANLTFTRVFAHYERHPLRYKLSHGDVDNIKAHVRSKDGKVVLRDDVQLTSGKVLRYHQLSSIEVGRFHGDAAPERVRVKQTKDLNAASAGHVAHIEFNPVPPHCPTKVWGLFPTWTAELERKARHRAVDGKLFFTITDKQYESAMACWHWSVEEITGKANTLIIPTDDVTIAKCKEHQLPCVVVADDELPKIKIWGDIGFLKYYAMALISGLGLDFIFSEMDVLVLSDPWHFHEKEDKFQWGLGDCRHYPHTMPGRSPKNNPRAEEAEIQVGAHFNHPRVNIGYIYAKWSPTTATFFAQLIAYYVAKCPDPVLGFDHRTGTFVDLGLPDQNIFDAFLRNHDHGHPKYSDIPWDRLPQIAWKLLDINLFGIWGRQEAKVPWVTFHYAGEGRKVVCWRGICEKMRKQKKLDQEHGQRQPLHFNRCVKPWQGAKCVQLHEGAPNTLQSALSEECLGVKIDCSKDR